MGDLNSTATRSDHPSSSARYWREVSRMPIWSAAEQHRLAVAYKTTRDPEIASRLVTATLRLVGKIAREYARDDTVLQDLIQEGNAGLIRGVERFDPSRGCKLTTYDRARTHECAASVRAKVDRRHLAINIARQPQG
jgi:DNA-directed RNA polymerase sigma subunit (sigma70/sigma32)